MRALLLTLLLSVALGSILSRKSLASDEVADSDEISKLKLLEEKNLRFLEKHKDKPSIQIKVKSNLVIIRLKIKALSDAGKAQKLDSRDVE